MAASLDSGEIRLLAEMPVADPLVPRVEVAEWWKRFGLVAGVTTRELGFNLGLWSGEPSGQVMTRWRAFRAALASRFPSIILGHQVHGAEMRWQERTPAGWLLLEGIDGHATADAGVLLTVTVADCIPVYLAAPDRGVLALLHAGWRGVAADILERAIVFLQARAPVLPSDIIMHCGIGVCGTCYEVGSEVAARVTREMTNGPTHVDLRGVLVARARALGIREVSRSPYCTVHDHDRFYSHRASGGQDGRMVAYLGRPQAAA
jgi:YfiH family protein